MQNKPVKFRITGVEGSALLLKKMNNSDLQGSENPTTKKKVDPATEAENAAHRLATSNGHKGQLGITAEGFRLGLILAAAGYKFGKVTARSVIVSSVMTTSTLVGLIDPETKQPIYDYEIDERPIVNKTTKGRSLSYRPKIQKWECVLELIIDHDFLPEPERLLPLFNRAGLISGAGSFRPQCKGTFGKYQVEMIS